MVDPGRSGHHRCAQKIQVDAHTVFTFTTVAVINTGAVADSVVELKEEAFDRISWPDVLQLAAIKLGLRHQGVVADICAIELELACIVRTDRATYVGDLHVVQLIAIDVTEAKICRCKSVILILIRAHLWVFRSCGWIVQRIHVYTHCVIVVAVRCTIVDLEVECRKGCAVAMFRWAVDKLGRFQCTLRHPFGQVGSGDSLAIEQQPAHCRQRRDLHVIQRFVGIHVREGEIVQDKDERHVLVLVLGHRFV